MANQMQDKKSNQTKGSQIDSKQDVGFQKSQSNTVGSGAKDWKSSSMKDDLVKDDADSDL